MNVLKLASFKNLLGTLFRSQSEHNRQVKIQDVQNQNANISIDQSTNKTVNQDQIVDRQGATKPADQIWKATLHIKATKPDAPSIMDLFGPNITNNNLESNKHFQAALSRLQGGWCDEMLQIQSETEQHKPYVSDRLWNLFHAYIVLAVKPGLLLKDEGLDAARNWPNDQIIKEILAADYMPEAIKGLREVRETPLMWCMETVEDELLQEVRRSSE